MSVKLSIFGGNSGLFKLSKPFRYSSVAASFFKYRFKHFLDLCDYDCLQ